MSKKFQLRLDPAIADKLNILAAKSGLSKSSVIRILINGAAIREMPSADFNKMAAELNAIGNNLNQIAFVANSTGSLDRDMYIRTSRELQTEIANIKTAVLRR